ncbi:MAG TPA: hypothetical protein ENI57_12195 [Ignavibacteria bacterium]|nr:hypothetical protein [Ignavibacteria bacterium]
MNDRLNGLLELYKKNPDDSSVIYGIALEYKSKKNYAKAENYFKMLVEKNPTYVPAYMQFAILNEEMNEINKAKQLYTEGIKIAKLKGDTHATQEMEDFLNELN